MILSAINTPKYKHFHRNIQSSFLRDYKGRTFSNKNNLNQKRSNSFKNVYKNRNFSSNTIELKSKSIDTEKLDNTILSQNKQSNTKNISVQKDFSDIFNNDKIYSSINSKITHLVSRNKYNKLKLYYILTKIEKCINNIFKIDVSDDKINSLQKNNKNLEEFNISINEKVEKDNKEYEINILKKKTNKLLLKINEIENKFRIERLSYLACIGENQKEISELKRKLYLASLNKLPKSEIDKVICFPRYAKFEIAEEINQKLTPMYLSNVNKNRTITPKVIQQNEQKKTEDSSFNQLFQTELKRNKHSSISSNENSNKKAEINKNESTNLEKSGEKIKMNEKLLKEKEINETIELGQKYFEKHIPSMTKYFRTHKKYFLCHPKLDYIKNINSRNNIIRWKLVNQINSLPKKISKLKTVSRTQKNTFVIFPSFLNETLLNIEKIKTKKNFQSIVNKFEEIYKLKLKSND